MAQRGRLEEILSNNELPIDMLGEVWRHHFYDFVFLTRASLVCRFWQQSAEQLAKQRFQFYFPDIYASAALDASMSWCRRLELAFLQYGCEFTSEELADYRAFRAGDWMEIQKILSSRDPANRVLLMDNQKKPGFYYLTKNHAHQYRQVIFDGIFSALADPYKTENGEWKEVFFDKNMVANWNGLVRGFDETDFMPVGLLLAVVCNQTDEIKKIIEPIKKKNKLTLWLQRLLNLALKFDQLDAFLLLLEYQPEIIFVLKDFFSGRNVSQHFADGVFSRISRMNLHHDSAKRCLHHWALILNQPRHFVSIPIDAAKKGDILNSHIIISTQSKASLRGRIELHAYFPIQFACMWGIELYNLAEARGASALMVSNILEMPARCGEEGLLRSLLTRANLQHSEENISNAMRSAIKNGHLNCVRVLLCYGAKINITHVSEALSLHQIHILDFFYQDKVLRELFKIELKAYSHGEISIAPLIRWFSFEYHTPLLKMLLKFGLNVNAEGGENKSPLHFLVSDFREDHSLLIRQLVANGALVDKLDGNKNTPLHCVVAEIDKALVGSALQHIVALIEAGADPNIRNIENKTVLDMLQDKLDEAEFKIIVGWLSAPARNPTM